MLQYADMQVNSKVTGKTLEQYMRCAERACKPSYHGQLAGVMMLTGSVRHARAHPASPGNRDYAE